MTSLAKLLVETLAAAGVTRIWGVTGDSLNGRGNGIVELATSNLFR